MKQWSQTKVTCYANWFILMVSRSVLTRLEDRAGAEWPCVALRIRTKFEYSDWPEPVMFRPTTITTNTE